MTKVLSQNRFENMLKIYYEKKYELLFIFHEMTSVLRNLGNEKRNLLSKKRKE